MTPRQRYDAVEEALRQARARASGHSLRLHEEGHHAASAIFGECATALEKLEADMATKLDDLNVL
jgi:hypothetical protein